MRPHVFIPSKWVVHVIFVKHLCANRTREFASLDLVVAAWPATVLLKVCLLHLSKVPGTPERVVVAAVANPFVAWTLAITVVTRALSSAAFASTMACAKKSGKCRIRRCDTARGRAKCPRRPRGRGRGLAAQLHSQRAGWRWVGCGCAITHCIASARGHSRALGDTYGHSLQ